MSVEFHHELTHDLFRNGSSAAANVCGKIKRPDAIHHRKVIQVIENALSYIGLALVGAGCTVSGRRLGDTHRNG